MPKPMTHKEFIKNMRKYVANIAIGPSTLRSQGKGVMNATRKFLIDHPDLSVLRKTKPHRYAEKLNQWTDKLARNVSRVTKNGYNWGAARKSMNIFMVLVFMNKYLAEEYFGDEKPDNNFRDALETPLDSQAREFLQKKAQGRLCKWNTIKGLNPEQSACYQEFALKYAKKKGIPRACLDIMIWRQV